MRLVWTAVVALCLVAASASRANQIDVGRDRLAPQLDAAPDGVLAAVKARRRAGVVSDGFAPVATVVAPPELALPRVVQWCAIGPGTDRCTSPLVASRSSRGPPRG